jgi:hypothetical protein
VAPLGKVPERAAQGLGSPAQAAVVVNAVVASAKAASRRDAARVMWLDMERFPRSDCFS